MKKSLNGDGLQFHQYQQNEKLPLILTKLADYDRLGTGTQICGVTPVNGISSPPPLLMTGPLTVMHK